MKNIPQIFSVPSPTITYLLKATSSKILEKLYQTCKYFYARLKITIVHHYWVDNHADEPFNLWFNTSVIRLNVNVNRLWVTENFYLGYMNSKDIIPNIVKCDVKELWIDHCTVTLEELKFLTESGNIKSLLCHSICCSSSNSSPVPVEELYPLIPKAIVVSFKKCTITNQTLEKLLMLDYPKNVCSMAWLNINQMFDPSTLDTYLKKCLEEKAKLHLCFENNDIHAIMEEQIMEKIAFWIPESSKPKIQFTKNNFFE